MKFLKIFFSCFFILQSCIAMEAPEPVIKKEIAVELASAYQQELKKFKKFNYENPERLIQHLRISLEKDKNLEYYLSEMQRFACLLFWQDQLLKEVDLIQFFGSYVESINNIRKIIDELLGIKRVKVSEEISLAAHDNPAIINEILLNPKIARTPGTYTKEDLDYIRRLLINENPVLNLYAIDLLINREVWQLSPIQSNAFDKKADIRLAIDRLSVVPLPDAHILEALSNTIKIIEAIEQYESKLARHEKIRKRTLAEKEYQQTFNVLAQVYKQKSELYALTYPIYNALYQAIRAELYNTINEQLELLKKQTTEQQLITKTKKPLISYLFLIPPTAGYPKSLPVSLDPFIPAREKFAQKFKIVDVFEKNLPSLMQRIKKEKEKEKIKRESKRKSRRRRQEQISAAEPIAKKLITAPDGSYILEGDITDKNIKIHDPKNDTIITLFKTKAQKEFDPKIIPPINYTDWVKMWFESPERALEVQGYNDPSRRRYRSELGQWFPIAIHSFSSLVDNFIFDLGLPTRVANKRNPNQKDYLLTIAGTMELPDGSQESGVFGYLIDSKNGQWYHRMFEPQEGSRIIDSLFEKGYFTPQMSGYYDVAFPPLGSK